MEYLLVFVKNQKLLWDSQITRYKATLTGPFLFEIFHPFEVWYNIALVEWYVDYWDQ